MANDEPEDQVCMKCQSKENLENLADPLTQVSKSWLQMRNEGDLCSAGLDAMHSMHHFGVDHLLYLARMVDPVTKREEVEECVKQCMQCKSIDLSPVTDEPGELGVNGNWVRLAVDATHYKGKCYLSIIDCGPSRFAIRREVCSENAREVTSHLKQILQEWGPPEEILVDNSAAFR